MEKQKLLFNQARLMNRGVAEMVLLHISASKGIPSEMVMTTLQLGIAILRGGNIDIQMGMLNHLKEKKDVGFFTSIAGLMNSCSVLDLDAFERNTKAEGTFRSIFFFLKTLSNILDHLSSAIMISFKIISKCVWSRSRNLKLSSTNYPFEFCVMGFFHIEFAYFEFLHFDCFLASKINFVVFFVYYIYSICR